jgi:hypothetical protein
MDCYSTTAYKKVALGCFNFYRGRHINFSSLRESQFRIYASLRDVRLS